jgi:hypothetical protein
MPDEEQDSMTQAQRDAICKAYTSLTEHFPRVLLVVDYDLDDGNGKEEDAHEGYWRGGALAAIGMCEFAKDRILHSGKKFLDPGEG